MWVALSSEEECQRADRSGLYRQKIRHILKPSLRSRAWQMGRFDVRLAKIIDTNSHYR